jgi:very-short-patch-repair endonuclease
VDGASHEWEEQRAFDAERTALLERSGWRVARIANADVFSDEGIYLILDEVVRA